MRDLTILESILVRLLGTMMSPEGQAAYDNPIRWMPHAADWARAYMYPNFECQGVEYGHIITYTTEAQPVG